MLSLANMLHYLVSSSFELPAALPAAFSLLYIKKGVFNKMNEKNENGRSMIEMLGVLAIIGVLSVGGIAGYSKAMMKFKINKTIEQVAQIVTNIRTLYIQQKDYNGLDTTTAIQMGAIPDDLETKVTNSWGSIKHSFGGDITLGHPWTADTSSGSWNVNSDDDGFYISITSLPKEACMALATTDWGSSDSSGIEGVLISYGSTHAGGHDGFQMGCKGSSSYEDGDSYYACSDSLPIKPATASSYCNSIERNSSDAGVVLYFK